MGDVRAVATGGYLTASGGGDVRAVATAGYLVTKGGARMLAFQNLLTEGGTADPGMTGGMRT
jgi:hypothetical protein